ncbi:MAG: histidine kinase [Gammaproteobacteria bacterium]
MNTTVKSIWQPVARPILWVHRRLLPRDGWFDWTPYLWLGFLAFYILNFRNAYPGAPAGNTTTLTINIIGILIFLCLYFRYYWHKQKEKPWIIAAIACLGYFFYLIPPFSGYIFIIYAAAFCGYIGTMRKGFIALIIITALFAVEGLSIHWLYQVPNILWGIGTFIGLIIGLTNIYFGELNRKNKALKQSEEEIRRLATTAERERIGRDLHDLLGHTLTLIAVKAELAARLAERDLAGAAREIRAVENISRDALQQVRKAVGGYRTGGLTGELANARVALTAANVKLAEKVEPPKLSPTQDSVLAMVLREAITNVVRHSGAQHCSIELENHDRQLRLLIEDDGRGGALHEGNGLKGMRERLQAAAGQLKIDSNHDGTRLTVLLPANPPAQACP